MCNVTPAAKANDWSKWGIISVDTGGLHGCVSDLRRRAGLRYVRSPIFSRVKGKWQTKYGLEEISMTARERAFLKI